MKISTRGVASACAALALAMAGSTAYAASVSIDNASFETGAVADTFTSNTAPPSWSVTQPSSTSYSYGQGAEVTPEFGAGSIPNGDAVAYFNRGISFTLSQTLGATATANTEYTLSAVVGDSASHSPYHTYDLGLLVGGTALTPTSTTLPTIPNNGSFVTATKVYEFTGTPGQPLSVQVTAPDQGVIGSMFAVDLVSLDAEPIPEPASVGLMGLGGLAMLARRRRA